MPAGAIDLDNSSRSEPNSSRPAERRERLIDQLAWLMDEAEALGPLLAGLPEWAVSQTALPGERSVKTALARIAALDSGPRTEWMRTISGGRAADLMPEEPAVNEADVAESSVGDLLNRLREVRGQFVDVVTAIPHDLWSRPLTFSGETATLYDVIMSIVREDADELRALAYRLHDGGVGSR